MLPLHHPQVLLATTSAIRYSEEAHSTVDFITYSTCHFARRRQVIQLADQFRQKRQKSHCSLAVSYFAVDLLVICDVLLDL